MRLPRDANDLLVLWSKPKSKLYHRDLAYAVPQPLCVELVRTSAVREQLIADIAAISDDRAEDDLASRRAEAAIIMLARGGEFRLLVDVVRARRGRTLALYPEVRVYRAAHRELGQHGDAHVAPTLIHFVATSSTFEAGAVSDLLRVDPARIRNHVLALARSGGHRARCVTWLRALGDFEAVALANELAAPVSGCVADRAVDPDQETRHRALKEIFDRCDPTTFMSLVLACKLDVRLRARVDPQTVPFFWTAPTWKRLMDKELIRALSSEWPRTSWQQIAELHRFGEQEIWPSVQPIVMDGLDAVVATYQPQRIDLDAMALAALLAEEADTYG